MSPKSLGKMGTYQSLDTTGFQRSLPMSPLFENNRIYIKIKKNIFIFSLYAYIKFTGESGELYILSSVSIYISMFFMSPLLSPLCPILPHFLLICYISLFYSLKLFSSYKIFFFVPLEINHNALNFYFII